MDRVVGSASCKLKLTLSPLPGSGTAPWSANPTIVIFLHSGQMKYLTAHARNHPRWVDHVPERYEVRVRDAGAYATRRRVWWRRRGVVLAGASVAPPGAAEPEVSGPALRARRRRGAELLRRVFKVEVEVCPRGGGAARIIGFVTEPRVVRRILAHLERRGVDAGAGPWARLARGFGPFAVTGSPQSLCSVGGTAYTLLHTCQVSSEATPQPSGRTVRQSGLLDPANTPYARLCAS